MFFFLPGYRLEERVPRYDPWFCSIISAISLFPVMSEPSSLSLILCSVFLALLHHGPGLPCYEFLHIICSIISWTCTFFSWNVETPNYISWSFTFFLGNVDTLIPLLKYSGIHVLSDTKSRTRVQKCSTDVRYSGRHLARDQQNNSVWLDW